MTNQSYIKIKGGLKLKGESEQMRGKYDWYKPVVQGIWSV